jgi:hypothetical protein
LKHLKKKLALFLMLFFIYFLIFIYNQVSALPNENNDNYYSSLEIGYTYEYDVIQFGKPSIWYTKSKSYYSNPGGEIAVTLIGFANKPINPWFTPANPDPVPYFNITFKFLEEEQIKINTTISNASTTECGSELVLGYNNYVPGFITSINWTNEKLMAQNSVNSSEYLLGSVSIDESFPSEIKMNFLQDNGNQKTTLIYNKDSGVLLYAKTENFFGNPILEFSLKGYSFPQPFGFSIELIILITCLSFLSLIALMVVFRKKEIISSRGFKFFIVGLIGASSITLLVLVQFGLFAPTGIGLNYCQNCKESISNVSLYVNYGNGTVDNWTGFSLENNRTSVFDAIDKYCNIEYKKYGPNQDTFYVASINGITEDSTHGWEFWVNGEYIWIASNLYALDNNSIITCNFTTGIY